MTTRKRYKIGELARLSGVSVKTLRFYADQGVLPPSEVTEGGHRCYTDLDHARLEAIRSLREVGVGLDTIVQVMQHEDSIAEALRLQLETVQLELAQLQRRKAVLSAALQRGDALTYLRGARSLAALGAQERSTFLARRVHQMLDGVPADPDWMEQIWGKHLLTLPEVLNDAQFEAWLELAELLQDEDFIARTRQTGQAYWGQFQSEDQRNQFMQQNQLLEAQVAAAVKQGETPHSARAREWVENLLHLQAETFGGRVTADFAREQLAFIAQHTDPRAARFWHLLGILHGWPPNPWPQRTHDWKVAALQHWASLQEQLAATGADATR